MDTGPALVSILRQGTYLIASIHTALDDSQMVRFQRDLIDQIGMHRSGGVIIDLAAVFCCRVRLNIDFQQLNGRRVGVIVAIVNVVLLIVQDENEALYSVK